MVLSSSMRIPHLNLYSTSRKSEHHVPDYRYNNVCTMDSSWHTPLNGTGTCPERIVSKLTSPIDNITPVPHYPITFATVFSSFYRIRTTFATNVLNLFLERVIPLLPMLQPPTSEGFSVLSRRSISKRLCAVCLTILNHGAVGLNVLGARKVHCVRIGSCAPRQQRSCRLSRSAQWIRLYLTSLVNVYRPTRRATVNTGHFIRRAFAHYAYSG